MAQPDEQGHVIELTQGPLQTLVYLDLLCGGTILKAEATQKVSEASELVWDSL